MIPISEETYCIMWPKLVNIKNKYQRKLFKALWWVWMHKMYCRIFIFTLQGMMMGLGKRSADSFYQNGKNEVRAAEFAKRKEYLEDIGMLNISQMARASSHHWINFQGSCWVLAKEIKIKGTTF